VSAIILDGKALADQIEAELATEIASFTSRRGVRPCLAAVLVGADPASEVYVRNKRRACERLGIDGRVIELPASTSTDELLARVRRLNNDASVHGILVQLPLPAGIDAAQVLESVHPLKDVDCFHAENVGRLVQGKPRFLPCTPHGIQQILARGGVAVEGAHVVIVGRSDIVGKPLANMLVQRAVHANATVTVCHQKTRDLPALTRQADILVAAIGRPRFITADMVKLGATVIDVGMNRTPGGLCGDVDFDRVREVAGRITPVPGGVGKLTIAMLMHNTLAAARMQVEAPVDGEAERALR
jgi:methylenetetrahydrofolate dehydrogenase (NADP+)/methenyltetrahydrofolate cyclohydrolase